MNKVVHFEIPTENQSRAKRFYGEVFGWQIQDMPTGDGGDVYTFAITSPIDEQFKHKESGAINGGIFPRKPELPVRDPVITIGVDSIDDHAHKIEAAGGSLVVPKGEVPDMGYYAYFKDTEGNLMGLWQAMKK
jgi:predicted enzyme related to lactoylglutathione lyase